MPSSSSFRAMASLSSTDSEIPSPCVPSRRVVSNVNTFMNPPSGDAAARYLDLLNRGPVSGMLALRRRRIPTERNEPNPKADTHHPEFGLSNRKTKRTHFVRQTLVKPTTYFAQNEPTRARPRAADPTAG